MWNLTIAALVLKGGHASRIQNKTNFDQGSRVTPKRVHFKDKFNQLHESEQCHHESALGGNRDDGFNQRRNRSFSEALNYDMQENWPQEVTALNENGYWSGQHRDAHDLHVDPIQQRGPNSDELTQELNESIYGPENPDLHKPTRSKESLFDEVYLIQKKIDQLRLEGRAFGSNFHDNETMRKYSNRRDPEFLAEHYAKAVMIKIEYGNQCVRKIKNERTKCDFREKLHSILRSFKEALPPKDPSKLMRIMKQLRAFIDLADGLS